MRTTAVLVIDVDKSSHWIYKRKLYKVFGSVSTCKSVEDAVELMNAGMEYDLIMLKHPCNNDQAVENYSKLLKSGYQKSIIVVAPGNHVNEIAEQYKGISGAVEVISKAINGTDLCSLLEAKVKKSQSEEKKRKSQTILN